ncbi:MAG: transglycosylase SLT domain-containing protein [archaeon]
MIFNKKIKICMILILGILVGLVSAGSYSSVNPNYGAFESFVQSDSSFKFNSEQCAAGQDFIVQVAPFGCSPAVVREDLLEEQDVPVFCALAATKINPLIDVDAIEGISFTGPGSEGVRTVGFYPAKAALGVKGDLNSPVLNNIGYAVIVLQKARNGTMPGYVSGNLTANLKYDIKNAFGIGDATFYLPELKEEEWSDKKNQFGFWSGRGYLRAEGINDDSAKIGIYDDIKRIGGATLTKGQTSNKIYIPGFDCMAGLQLKLDGLEAPNTRAKLDINGDIVEVKEGEKFLENRCTIKGEPEKKGLSQKVTINCIEDGDTGFWGSKDFDLVIEPRVKLEIDGVEKDYGVGDVLYEDAIAGRKIFLGYIGNYQGKKFIIPVASTAIDRDKFLSSFSSRIMNNYVEASEGLSMDVFIDNLNVETMFFKNKGLVGELMGLIVKGTDIGNRISEGQTEDIRFLGVEFKKKESNTLLGKFTENIVKYWGKKKINEFVPNYNSKKITFVGFTTPQNDELRGAYKENYDNAVSDYNQIIEGYNNERYKDEVDYGEEALVEKIFLMDGTGQKKTMVDLCNEFKEKYSESKHDKLKLVLEKCNNLPLLSSSEFASKDISINGQAKRITFVDIVEPSEKEYSAVVQVSGAGVFDGEHTLGKDERINKPGEWFELKEVHDDYVIIYGPSARGTIENNVGLSWKNHKIELGKSGVVLGESRYEVKLVKVNLKKLAKVSVISNIDNVGAKANFSFKIGIDKRDIKLSPEKINEKLENLKGTIAKWEKNSESLGKVVKTMKGACLATGATLTIKNLLDNMGGKSIARSNIMRMDGGIYDMCVEATNGKGEWGGKGYERVEQCYNGESKFIDDAVDKYGELLSTQNNGIKQLQDGCTGNKNPEECFREAYANQVKSEIVSSGLSNIDVGGGKTETVSEIADRINKDSVSVEQLRRIQLNLRARGDVSFVGKKLNSDLKDVWVTTDTDAKLSSLMTDFKSKGYGNADVSWNVDKDAIKGNYKGWTIKKSDIVGGDEGYFKDEEIYNAKIQGHGSDRYLFILDSGGGSKYGIVKAYKFDGFDTSNKIKISPVDQSITRGFEYTKYDKNSYNNPYDSSLGFPSGPSVRYFETGPNKEFPSVVPFDKVNGWYAATTNVLGGIGSSGMSAYGSSGALQNYYICNVGENGREENRGGDDICRSFNKGTGQAVNFPGIESEGEVLKLMRCAEQAVNQAAKAYKPGVGSVRINSGCGASFNAKVGNPAVDIPEMQCQDFMSPKDCKILFNVCDPVVCPSSRCDLGGAYPVRDVVQSGIIGSLTLCAHNFVGFGGDVYVPVCLSGVKAGIDGYLSVVKSYRDCLQESLDTGETVGICDEIYSIHLCEFFWRQGVPFAKMIIPKAIEWLMGKNVRGGGEYLTVSSAWDTADKSVEYFTQYYAANSFKAFKARSAEEVGGEVCKNFASGVYPEGTSVLDALTEPDSPPQFHGRFDEIPFTDATVPPISHYKVFYHIYAGNDSRAYYKVYLKDVPSTSFYQDITSTRLVGSGYIARGGYVSETKDFTAPAGYKTLCIQVNDQEECGFKQVSTSFAVNYVEDKYLEEQSKEMNIKTEKECISGTVSAYSLLSPNLQEGVEETINPQIYNRGIIRVCSTGNPGIGTDSKAEAQGSRWVQVGNCGSTNMKCWLDTSSVKNVIENTNIENGTLEEVYNNYKGVLVSEGKFVDERIVKSEIDRIDNLDNNGKISEVSKLIGKVYMNSQKARLLLIRGNAYKELAIGADQKIVKETIDKVAVPKTTTTSGDGATTTTTGTGADGGESVEEISSSTDSSGDGVLENIKSQVATLWKKVFGGDSGVSVEESQQGLIAQASYGFDSPVTPLTKEDVKDALKKTGFSKCADYVDAVYEVSEGIGINPLLVTAVMMQESSCDNKEATGGSIGLMQVSTQYWCGTYGLSYDKEECKNELINNPKKNIEVGARILKSNYNAYGLNNGRYKTKVESFCKTDEYQKKYLIYDEWTAALRAYNGFGCSTGADVNYVENIINKYKLVLDEVDSSDSALQVSA